MANSPQQERHGVILDYLKVVTWPLLTVCLIITFWGPLQAVAAVIPELLSNSEEFTVGKITVKIRGKARTETAGKATAEVIDALRGLRADDVRQILEPSESTSYLFCGHDQTDPTIQIMKRLELNKLVTRMTPQELAQDKESCVDPRPEPPIDGYRVTPLYESARTFLIDLLPPLLDDVGRAKAAQPKPPAH
jgi:hypothetical protein